MGTPVIGLLVAAAVLVIAAGVLSRLGPRELDRSSRDRIRDRLDEIGRRAGTPTSLPVGSRAGAVALPERHARLWRDTAVVMVLLGAAIMLALTVNQAFGPTGAVLEATWGPGGSPGEATFERLQPSSESFEASATPTAAPTLMVIPSEPPPTPAPSPAASAASVTPVSSASPADATAPSPRALATTAPGATRDRMALLTPCRDRTDCHVYGVRQGDNLVSIAHWFGVPFEAIVRMNPDVGPIRAGDRLLIPTPTR